MEIFEALVERIEGSRQEKLFSTTNSFVVFLREKKSSDGGRLEGRFGKILKITVSVLLQQFPCL